MILISAKPIATMLMGTLSRNYGIQNHCQNALWSVSNTFFVVGASAQCSGPGTSTPLVSRLCGPINILSTQTEATKASIAVYGKYSH